MRALSWNDVLPQQAPTPRQSAASSRLRLVRDAVARQPLTLRVALALVAAVAAALLAFALFANARFDVGPGEVSVSAVPAVAGSTTLSLPPFGSVTAPTHSAPLAVTASLDEIDPGRLQTMALGGIPKARTLDVFKSDVRRGIMRAVGKGLVAALVAAAFVGWSLRRSWRTTVAAGVLGVVVPALMVAGAVTGFDQKAFRSPRYSGAMRYAPAVIALFQDRYVRVDNLQSQLDGWVKQFQAFYSHPQTFSAGGAMPHTMRVLQVSDLHLDPVGFKLESELIDEFHVSVVLDAGDTDDYGTALEATMIQRFLDHRVPRIYVPGNHESPTVVGAIDRIPNVTVLSSSTVTVDGLSVYGLADPMSRSTGWTPDNALTGSQAASAAAELRSRIASGATNPQIIATHNPVGLVPFAGMAPLLVAGHTHMMDLGRIGSSWYVNSGTVGGVDFAKLYSDPSMPHGASILYYTQTLPRRLVAIDQISVWGRTDQTSLKRTIVDPQLLDDLKREAARPAGDVAAKR